MEADERTRGSSWRWSLLLSVVFLNICIPTLVLSYGVLLIHQIDLGVPVWLGLSTPTIFILIYSLTQCWCREAADSWGGSVGFRVMAALGLLAIVIGLLTCAFIPLYLHPYIYGILGGFGSSLISAQVDAVIFDTYDTQLGIIRGLCFTGQAIGLSIFPHILSIIINQYGYQNSFIVLCAIMIQTLPAVLFLKVDYTIRRPVSFSRYSDKTYAIFNNDGIDNSFYTAELQLHDLSKKCWKSPSDDNLHSDNNVNDLNEEVHSTITPPPSPEEKRRNIFGVEILPEIPEESEDSEDDEGSGIQKNNRKNRLSVAIKRLSTLGDNLDDCISNQSRRDSQSDKDVYETKDYAEVEVTYDNISPVTDIQREKIFNSFSFRCQSAYASMRRRMWMPSYKIYRLQRRMLYLMYNVNDIFIKPLTRSLSCWRFYPSLCLAFVKLSTTAVPQAALQLMATKMVSKISTSETNFLMTLYAFTWICFLLSTPWLAQTPKRNYKYIALIGLIISTAAYFVLAVANNYDKFSIGIVIAGFGHGAISSSWETAVQDFVGSRKWPKIHSPLETVTGTLLACFVLGVSFIVDQEGGLQLLLLIYAVTLSVITLIWAVIVAISIYENQVRSSDFGRRWLL